MKKIYTTKSLLLLIILTICGSASASDFYWVGGTGNWSAFATHWATTSGGGTFQAAVPTSADNVFFDASSFTAGGQTVTVDVATANCNNMDWTGATNTPTLAGSTTLNIYGSLTFVSGMNVTFSNIVQFLSTVTGNTVTTAGKTLPFNAQFNGTGAWTLQDNFTTTKPLYHGAGTLNTNGVTLNLNSSSTSFSNAQTGTAKTMNLGSSIINAAGSFGANGGGLINGGTSVINIAGSNPSTFNASGATVGSTFYDINFTASAGSTPSMNGGGMTFHNITSTNPTLTIDGNSIYNNVTFSNGGSITGSNTFNDLTFNPGSVSSTYNISFNKTQIINGNITANGNCSSNVIIQSNPAFIATTLKKTSGTVTLTKVTLTYMTFNGGATFTATSSVDGGNNTGITISAGGGSGPADLYWIGGTGNWSDATHWSLTSGGVFYNGGGCGPEANTNVHFDANSFSGAGQTVTLNVPAGTCHNMDWTGSTGNPTFAMSSNTINLFGSLTFISGMTTTGTPNIALVGTTSGNTITTAGKFLGSLWEGTPGSGYPTGSFGNGGIGGVWDLLDDFISPNASILCQYGTINTNNHTITCTMIRTDFQTGGNNPTINPGTTTFNLQQFRGNGGPIAMNASASTFNISGNNFNNAGMNGATCSFGNINFTEASGTVTLATCGTSYGNISNTNSSFTFSGNGVNTFGNFDMHVPGCTITGTNTFNNLTLNTTGGSYSFPSGKTQTITGSVIGGTGSCASLLVFSSTSPGATISKASGTVTLDFGSLTWMKATGGATFTDNDGVDGGNNTGWTINSTTAADLYWIGGTGNWSDGSHWSTTSGGSAWAGCFPAATTNVHFDVNSFTAPGQTVTVNIAANCKNMDWTGATNNPAFAGSSTLNIYGSLTLISGMTSPFSGAVTFLASTTGQTIDEGGLPNFGGNPTTFGPQNVAVGNPDWTLVSNFAVTHPVVLNYGTLFTNGKTLTVGGNFGFNSSTIAKTLNMGSSIINCSGTWQGNGATGLTYVAGTSTINMTGNSASFNVSSALLPASTIYDVNFTGGGSASFTGQNTMVFHNISCPTGAGTFAGNNICNNVNFGGTTNISGSNTFNNFTFNPSASATLTLTSAKIQTINGSLNLVGSPSILLTIKSSTAASASAFSKTSGTVCADYVSLKDNTASGGATFNAGTHSTNVSGNTGWAFPSSLTPAASIAAIPSTGVCPGNNVQFTATPTYGGTPNYNWLVNGVSQQNGASAVFNTNTLNGGDVVAVSMTSTAVCATPATVSSNNINQVIFAVPAVTVNPQSAVCTGLTNAILTASGASTYTWLPVTNLTPSSGAGATVTAQISQLTFYTVTGTSSNGCTSTATVPVATVATGGTVAPNYSIICSGGTKLLTVTGAAGHDYQWQISSDNVNWSNIGSATNTTYTTNTTDGNTNKYYRLLSQSNTCWNVASTTAEVDVSQPAIAITSSGLTDNSVTLNWTPVGSGNYNISYSGASSGTVLGTTPPKTLNTLTANGNYTITLNQTGTGLGGCPATGTISLTTLCTAPISVTVTGVGNTSISLSWTGGAGNYKVYYRPLYAYNGYFTKDVIGATSTTLTTQGGTQIYKSVTYEIHVAKLDCPNAGNIGQASANIYATTTPALSCTAPVIDSVRSLCPVQIEAWVHGSPTNQYYIDVQRLTPTVQPVTSYPVTGGYFTMNSSAGQTYLITARSICGGAVSNMTLFPGNLQVKPQCGTLGNLVLSNPTCSGFTASWNADQCISNNISYYQLFIRQVGTINWNGYGVAIPPSPVGPYKVVNWLGKGKNFQAFAKAVYSCNGYLTYGATTSTLNVSTLSAGCREEDDQQPQEIKATVQQMSNDNSEVFSLYPNPSNGKFTVELSRLNATEDAVRIEVMNMVGQTILTDLTNISGGQMSEFINMPATAVSGNYIIRVTVGKNVYTSKINISK